MERINQLIGNLPDSSPDMADVLPLLFGFSLHEVKRDPSPHREWMYIAPVRDVQLYWTFDPRSHPLLSRRKARRRARIAGMLDKVR